MEFIQASNEDSHSNFRFDWCHKVDKLLPLLGLLVNNLQNNKNVQCNLPKIKKFLSIPVFSILKTFYGKLVVYKRKCEFPQAAELLFFIREFVAILSEFDSWFDIKNTNERLIGCKILVAAALMVFCLNWDILTRKMIVKVEIIKKCMGILNSYKGESSLNSSNASAKECRIFRKTEGIDGNSKRLLEWTDDITSACISELKNRLYKVFWKPVFCPFIPLIFLYQHLKIERKMKVDKRNSNLNQKSKFIRGSLSEEFIGEVNTYNWKQIVDQRRNINEFETPGTIFDASLKLFNGSDSSYGTAPNSPEKLAHLDIKIQSDPLLGQFDKTELKSAVTRPIDSCSDLLLSLKLFHEIDSGYETAESSPEKLTDLDIKIQSKPLLGQFDKTQLKPAVWRSIESRSDFPPWLNACQCGGRECSACIDEISNKNFMIGMKTANPDIHCGRCKEQISEKSDFFKCFGLLYCEHIYCYFCFLLTSLKKESCSQCLAWSNFSPDVLQGSSS